MDILGVHHEKDTPEESSQERLLHSNPGTSKTSQDNVITDDEFIQWKREIALIDQQLLSKMTTEDSSQSVKTQTRPDCSQLKEPPDIEELLTTDPKTITATSQNCHVLNIACQNLLKQMEKQIIELLEENRKSQNEVVRYLSTHKKPDTSAYSNTLRLRCAGMPYFKDVAGYPQPNNEDVEEKLKRRELLPADFITVNSTWNRSDTATLKKAVFGSAKTAEIHNLSIRKNEIMNSVEGNIGEKLKIIDQEIENLNSKSVVPVDSKAVDWMKISTIDMKGKYSEAECESRWVLSLSPNINKSRWGRSEIQLLEEKAEEHKWQDWDKIADELGTNRTGFQCSVAYHTRKGLNEGKWTAAEDQKLKKLVDKYRIGNFIPWPKITWFFETRSIRQCHERYDYHLKTMKKGAFDPTEDKLLIYGAKRFSNDFRKVSQFLPDRAAPQIRARYEYLVGVSMPDFTKEEDRLLVSLIQVYSGNWERISDFFEDRSVLQCRKRWVYLQRKLGVGQKSVDDISSDEEAEAVENIKINSDIAKLVISVKNAKQRMAGTNNPLTRIQTAVKNSISNASEDGNLEANVITSLYKSGRRKQNRPTKKLSGSVSKLYEYLEAGHEYLFGPKPRKPTSEEEKNNLCDKLRVAMATLSAETDLSTKQSAIDFAKNSQALNSEDIALLEKLAAEDKGRNEGLLFNHECINKALVPPNYTSLVGLRTLTLVRSRLAAMASESEPAERPCSRNPDIDYNSRLLFSDAKLLWQSRIKSLFTLPIACSLIPQTEPEVPFFKGKPKKPVKVSKRKRKAHAVMMSRIGQMKKQHSNLSKEELQGLMGDLGSSSMKKTAETKKRKAGSSSGNEPGAAGVVRRKRGRPSKAEAKAKAKAKVEVLQNPEGEVPVKRARMIRVTAVKKK